MLQSLISFVIETASYDDKPCSTSEGGTVPQNSLQLLSADRARKLLFLCHFLGTPTLQPVSDISCYMELGLQVRDGTKRQTR